MMFVAGRLIFGGAGTITTNRAIVSEMEVEMAEFEVELSPQSYDVEVAAPVEAEVPEPVEVETD